MQYSDLFTDEMMHTGRPEDLEISGSSIMNPSKHKDYMKRNIAFAEKCIQQRLRDLGLTQNIGFDTSRIFYNVGGMNPAYIGNLDIITIPFEGAPSPKILIHELLHAYSSEWQGKEIDTVVARRHLRKKQVSSGFSISTKKDEGAFGALNEGMTDIITYSLLQKNRDEFDTLNEINNEAREGYLSRLRASYANDIANLVAQIPEYEAQRKEKIKKEKEENHRKAVEEFKKAAKESYKDYKNSGDKRDFDSDRHYNRKIYKISESTDESWDEFFLKNDPNHPKYATEIYERFRDVKDRIIRDTSIDTIYKKEVQLVEVFIDMIAYARTKRNNQDFSMNREDIWKELQRYYIMGNLQGLRRLCEEVGLEKGDGKNLFLFLSELKPGSQDKDNQIGKIISDMVEYIRESFNTEYQAPKEK